MERCSAVLKGRRRLVGAVSYCNVRLGARSFEAVSNEAGHAADAAAKVMTPSGAPDPLSTALPYLARLDFQNRTCELFKN